MQKTVQRIQEITDFLTNKQDSAFSTEELEDVVKCLFAILIKFILIGQEQRYFSLSHVLGYAEYAFGDEDKEYYSTVCCKSSLREKTESFLQQAKKSLDEESSFEKKNMYQSMLTTIPSFFTILPVLPVEVKARIRRRLHDYVDEIRMFPFFFYLTGEKKPDDTGFHRPVKNRLSIRTHIPSLVALNVFSHPYDLEEPTYNISLAMIAEFNARPYAITSAITQAMMSRLGYSIPFQVRIKKEKLLYEAFVSGQETNDMRAFDLLVAQLQGDYFYPVYQYFLKEEKEESDYTESQQQEHDMNMSKAHQWLEHLVGHEVKPDFAQMPMLSLIGFTWYNKEYIESNIPKISPNEDIEEIKAKAKKDAIESFHLALAQYRYIEALETKGKDYADQLPLINYNPDLGVGLLDI